MGLNTQYHAVAWLEHRYLFIIAVFNDAFSNEKNYNQGLFSRPVATFTILYRFAGQTATNVGNLLEVLLNYTSGCTGIDYKVDRLLGFYDV